MRNSFCHCKVLGKFVVFTYVLCSFAVAINNTNNKMADDMWATPVVNGNATCDVIGSPPSTDSAIHSGSPGNILIDLDSQPSITPQSPPSFDPLVDIGSSPKDAPPTNQQQMPSSFDPLADLSSAPQDAPPVNQQVPPPYDPLADLIATTTTNPFTNAAPLQQDPPPEASSADIFDPVTSNTTDNSFSNTEMNTNPLNPFSAPEPAPTQPEEVVAAIPPQESGSSSPKPDLTGAPGAPVAPEQNTITETTTPAEVVEENITPAVEPETNAAPPGGVSAPVLLEELSVPEKQNGLAENNTICSQNDEPPAAPSKESTFTVETKTENESVTENETKTETEVKTETKTEVKTETKTEIKTENKNGTKVETQTTEKTVRTQAKTPSGRSTTRSATGTPRIDTSRAKSVPAPASRIPTSPRKTSSPRTPLAKGASHFDDNCGSILCCMVLGVYWCA